VGRAGLAPSWASPRPSPPVEEQSKAGVFLCIYETSEEVWVGNELGDWLIGDNSWLEEACYRIKNRRRLDFSDMPFELAMPEIRSMLIQMEHKAIVIRKDRAVARIIRLGRVARVEVRRRKLQLYMWVLKYRIIGDRRRNLKRYKSNRKEGEAHLGVLTVTPNPKKCDEDRRKCSRMVKRGLPKLLRHIERVEKTKLHWVYVGELTERGYLHLHVLFYSEKPLKVFKWKGIWRFSDKREWEKGYDGGFIDAFALRDLGSAEAYVMKYLRKQLEINPKTDGAEENWKSYGVEFSYWSGVKLIGASRSITREARRIVEEWKTTKSKLAELEKTKQHLPAFRVGNSMIPMSLRAVNMLAKAFHDYVLACERHRSAQGVERHIEHPSKRLYHDLIIISSNILIYNDREFRWYILDLLGGLDPPVDLWIVLWRSYVIDRFSS